MNRKKLLFGIIFFTQISILASSKDNFQQGLLILNNGDTITCLIEVFEKDIFIYSDKIKYKIDEQKLKIKSSDVAMIKFNDLIYEKFKIKSKKHVQEGPRQVWVDYTDIFFAALVKDGNIKLYNHYFLQTKGTFSSGIFIPTGTYLDLDYYIKKNDKLKKIDKLGFKHNCQDLFHDCNQAIEKLEEKEFKYKTIEDLVDFVNSNCY